MRTWRPHRLAGLLAGLIVLAVAAGCGLQPASQFTPPVTGQGIRSGSLAGAKLSVTSKEFTEQILLGKITVLALKAAGADVTDKTNVKGSVNARTSLVRGDSDMMWEYTGTGWITYLGHSSPIPAAEQQFQAVRQEDLRRNRIDWLPWANFNNTYAFAVTQQTARRYGLTKLSDIVKVPPAQRTFCLEDEFYSRADGFPGVLRAYGLPAPPGGQLKKEQAGVVYTDTARGACLFGEVYDTDGRIQALHLTTLTDDRHFFPLYNPSLTVRAPVLAKYPQLATVERQIAARLSTQVMRRLNAKVDVQGEEPVLVARDWLREQGLIR